MRCHFLAQALSAKIKGEELRKEIPQPDTWAWPLVLSDSRSLCSCCLSSRAERRFGFSDRHAEGLQQLQELPAEEQRSAESNMLNVAGFFPSSLISASNDPDVWPPACYFLSPLRCLSLADGPVCVFRRCALAVRSTSSRNQELLGKFNLMLTMICRFFVCVCLHALWWQRQQHELSHWSLLIVTQHWINLAFI